MSALASSDASGAVAPASAGPSYTAPTSVADVIAAMAGGARVVAGGTDLVVGSRQGKWSVPDHLVAIHRVEALRGIRTSADGGLWLGALATHLEIADNERIARDYPALAEASAIVGSRATRNAGTVGGNLINASPAAETTGPLICFGATCSLESSNGHREMAVEDLFTGPGRTVTANDELLVSVTVPAPAAGTGSCYARLEYRRQMEIAVVAATAVVTLEGGLITSARIAITSLAPTVRRVPGAEAALVGTPGHRAAADLAAAVAAGESQPIDDVRAAADYRRAMAAVITRRVIEAAVARARGEDVPMPASATLVGAL